MVHVVEEELIRSNARRAFMVGYMLGITHDAIHQLDSVDSAKSAYLRARLDELYPLIDKEFYGGIAKPSQRKEELPNE